MSEAVHLQELKIHYLRLHNEDAKHALQHCILLSDVECASSECLELELV